MKRFVVISGLPGSGKSTLGRRLAAALDFALIDKDDLLEELFELRGIGDRAWRRHLSRESDLLLSEQAIKSNSAVLVSHWHLPGMPSDSGTPTEWLPRQGLVHVHCVCPPELAAARFLRRIRHPGHRDSRTSYEVLASIREVEEWGILDLEPRVDVNTSDEPDLQDLLRQIPSGFTTPP